jgi:hypothetical protein
VWFLSMLIGRSITGIQAADIVKLTSILKKETSEIYAIAKGELSPVLLHAAAFDTTIKKVALIQPCSSYRSLVTNLHYSAAYIHSAVPAALTAYDLPDLAASLAPKKLLITDVRDGAGNKTDSAIINKDLSIIKEAYHHKNANESLEIYTGDTSKKREDLYKVWIK